MDWWKRLEGLAYDLEHLRSFSLAYEDDRDMALALEAVKRVLDRRSRRDHEASR